MVTGEKHRERILAAINAVAPLPHGVTGVLDFFVEEFAAQAARIDEIETRTFVAVAQRINEQCPTPFVLLSPAEQQVWKQICRERTS